MLNEGQLFAHFRIARLLGEGGMGQVYLAEDQKLHRSVAIKILTADLFGDSERRERFHREARTAAQISHANVMAIYDIGSAPDPGTGQPLEYIVMEYIKGKSLGEYLKSRSSDLASVVRLAEKIASGLAAAHKIKVVHRDIKSENIMVDDDDQPKILDFGLAKPVDPVQFGEDGGTKTVSQELTRAGKILGTVTYMSPEQVRGEAVDTRSDIFSFGVLLYRMVTGELPFSGQSQVSTLAKILESRHESARVHNADIPAEMERIIDKCLQKDPNDRYQDTRDLVVDLRNLRRQYDSGVSDRVTGQITAPVSAVKGGAKWKRWVTLAAAVVVLALLYVLTERWMAEPSSGGGQLMAAENGLAILGFDNKTGDAQYDWLQTGLPEILQTDLAQSPSVTVVSRDRILDNIGHDKSGAVSHEEYVRAARALGATRVLSGAFYRFGDSLRIDARLEDVGTGKVVLGEKVVGSNPWALVDSLTAKIAVALNVTGPAGGQTGASAFASTPEAYKEYHLGMEKFGLDLYDDAIVLFKKALEVDSTFALAYMRIGMAHAFQGRQQQGMAYFVRAKRFEQKLPVKERSLLDVYSDLWQTQRYDRALPKMQSLVRDYPDDVEMRAFYALILDALTSDSVTARAQMDTVLRISPGFQLILSYLSERFSREGNLDSAIEYEKRLKKFHPDSPTPYGELGRLYIKRQQYDEAIKEYDELHQRFPEETRPYFDVSDIYILKRDLNKAEEALRPAREKFSNDHQGMSRLYSRLASIEAWRGRFKMALDYSHRSLNEELALGDSARITNACFSLVSAFELLDQRDSALYYCRQAQKTASQFQGIAVPLQMVFIDHSTESVARPMFKTAIEQFKAHLPSEIWPLADAIQEEFDAQCRVDTAAMIAASIKIGDLQAGKDGYGNYLSAGQLLVLTGRYAEAQKYVKYAVGEYESTDGWAQPIRWYYMGRLYEGLNDKANAIKYYSEMLRYWGNADIEIKQIRDARARLAALQS